jgi:Cu/Ag efflux pump CusA
VPSVRTTRRWPPRRADFGLIVDGAVIIVENAARRLAETRAVRPRALSPEERRVVVQEATLEVRSVSVFGELIIGIVYLPILALRGVGGKLFHPMARTVLFFVNVPFAAVGGVLGLWVRDIPFSIPAGVGFIALFGVAVLNGLVLVSFCLHLGERGAPPRRAIAEAAELRLRPVLMTALVAALGFVPMALSRAPGSEVQCPLATVVIAGLITATALTLLLFPAVYTLAHRERRSSRAADV